MTAAITALLALFPVLASPAPRPPVPDVWVIPEGAMTPAERLLVVTLQGLVGAQQPRIWIAAGGGSQIVLEQLRKEGTKTRDAGSAWDLLREFGPSVKGAIVCKIGTPSINVATSLCGPLGGVAVDESLLERAKAAGLAVLLDVRGMDERQALERYGDRFAHGIVVEQATDKPGHLRDFAVANGAFTFYTTDDAFRTEVARRFGPEALCFGWGPDEYRWVQSLSRANATGVPADWCVNLSAMAQLPAPKMPAPPRPAARSEPGVRHVAFVMSDGDNLQFVTGGFPTDRSFWGSPLRGTFPMTWEIPAVAGLYASRVLQHLYATATKNDGFVTGAGVPGYTFPHFQPDRQALAAQAGTFMGLDHVSIASVLNANEGSPAETTALLDLPQVSAVIYKDYSPYHRRRGEVTWHRGKPCVAYRYVLWEGLMSPEEVAREVATLPADPADERSYALVNVHAWSFGKSGGPMEAVRRTIGLLPPDTRVVTANQLIALMVRNLGAKRGGRS